MSRKTVILLFFFAISSCYSGVSKKEQIETLLVEQYKKGNFNGTFLIAEKGVVICDSALGYADLRTKEPLIRESPFYLASVSKQFTAMAVMILKEAGKLSYDDTLKKFFPDFPDYGNKITIRHLLHHSSGIKDYFGIDELDIKPGLNNEDVYQVLKKQKGLDFEPGENRKYSNSGYLLLSMIVEKVSNQSFPAFLKENIFEPLNMNRTLVYDQSTPHIPNRAVGFNKDGDLDDYTILTTGDGGIFSTTGDLFKWDQSLYSDILVSRPTLNEAFENSPSNNGTVLPYGFGWMVEDNDKGKSVYHGGGLNGYRTFIWRDLTNQITVIFLTNKGTSDLKSLTSSILKILQ